MAKQKIEERKLSDKLLELSHGKCEICGSSGYPFGLRKHEIIKRSQNGDATDPLNTLLLCMSGSNINNGGGCHDHVKYPQAGTPLSIEKQLKLANKLHEGLIK